MTAAMTTMERMKEAGMGPATLVNLICDICAFGSVISMPQHAPVLLCFETCSNMFKPSRVEHGVFISFVATLKR